MRSRAALLTLLLCAAPAHADSVDLTVTTLLTGRADPRDGELHTILPVYESVSALAAIRMPHTAGVRLVLSGWGAMILDIPRDQRWTGDIDLGYLETASPRQRLQLRLGRHFITGGGAARYGHLDGLSAQLRLGGGVGISAYAGAPVTPRFGVHRGDVMFGGRLYYRPSYATEMGLSFNQILDVGRVARRDLALDARWQAHRTLTLTGYALLSLVEARLAEVDVAAQWQPLARLQVTAEYRRTAPDLYLPLSSIFAVFSQETRDEVGGDVYLRPLPRLRLYADYHAILNMEGLGHRAGGRASVALGQRDHTTLSGELRVLKLQHNGYVQARVYSLHRLSPGLLATLSANLYFLDQPINQQDYSLTGAGTLSYEFLRGFHLVGTAMADMTPFATQRMEFILRLAYQATRRFREVRP